MDAGNGRGGGLLAAACAAHQKQLLDYARQLLGARRGADAPDFVQETMTRFLATFRKQPPPEPRCAGWLMTTLTRLLISDWRKQAVRKKAMADPALRLVVSPQPDPPEPSPGPMNALLDRLDGDAFKKAVDSLSPKLREAYELHVLGLSHAEIAARLNLSDNAVRKRLHDARKLLRSRLQLGLDEDEGKDAP